MAAIKKSATPLFKPANFKFRLSGRTWLVKFEKVPEREEDIWGRCDADKAIIYVDPNQNKEGVKITFFHEITHAFHRNLMLVKKLDHEVSAECCAEGMNEVLPQLVKLAPWLFNL